MRNIHYFCLVIELKLKSMTREEYFDVVGSMHRYCSMLHISETRERLDLADWYEQVYYLCKLAEETNKIIDIDRQSLQMSIEHWFELRRLCNDLDDVLYDLSWVVGDMEEGQLPGSVCEEVDDDWYESKEDDYNRTMNDFEDVKFIDNDEMKIIEDAGATVMNILDEYRNTLKKLSTIVKRANDVIDRFHDGIYDIDTKFSAYLADLYYSFLECKEAGVEESLVARLYEKYVDRLDEQLEPRHWSAMLKDYLAENDDTSKQIIRERFSYTRALDISDHFIQYYLIEESNNEDDVHDFFNYFLELAIIQSKVRSDIKIKRRPVKAETVEPLPSGVVDRIRNNAVLNRLFRDALGRLLEKVGARKKWQWSHVKKVLEDDRFIEELGQKGFGDLINGIFPDIDAEKVRQSVKNHPIKDGKFHYRKLPETNASRQLLIDIGEEFEELRKAME